ncbi:MAG: diguanylate cyclase domain-containing protein [Acidothermaceae bacterium]
MKSPDDRNARPRPGSLLWWYVWAVVACATVVVTLTTSGLNQHAISSLLANPGCWLVAAPLAVIAVRPLLPALRDGDPTFALVVFLFALLLRAGLPASIVLCVVTMVVRGCLAREAIHRNLFNASQHVLTLSAAWLVLRAFSISPSALHPWSFHEPSIEASELVGVLLAGSVYLVFDNFSVYIAISLIEHRPVLRIARDDLRHIAMVAAAMASLSPLVVVVMVHLWPFVPLFYPALVSLYYNARLSTAREHAALHDSLTGLGNRELLHREAETAIEDLARQGDAGLAILVIDLDKFKEVNDTLGHAAGDQLLRVVAERLLAAMRSDDVVARLGGDEFVALIHDVPDTAVARIAALRLLEQLVGTCQIDGVAINVGASIGVAVAPEHGREFDALLRCADRAMYIAKASGCGVAVFDPGRDDGWRRPPVVLDAADASSTTASG